MFIITRALFGNTSRKSLDKLNDMVPLLYSSARHSIGCLAKRNIYRYPFMGVLLVFLGDEILMRRLMESVTASS